MATQAARGKKALGESKFEEAIEAYSAALQEHPTSPDYLIQRSTAFQRAKKYPEALRDAEHAVVNAQKRAKKELIDEAQLRRGIVLFQLGKYGDAEFVFQLIKQRNTEHKMANMWHGKTVLNLKKDDLSDDQKKATVTETPTPQSFDVVLRGSNGVDTADNTSETLSDAPFTSPTPSSDSPPRPQTSKEQVRYEWYQNTVAVYLTLYAKVDKETTHIEITENSLNVSFPLATGSSYDLTLDPLFGPVNAERRIIKFFNHRFEIILVKAIPGLKWSALEAKGKEPVITQPATTDDDAVKRAVLSDANATAPSYPTSSKTGPKNWDKITDDLRAAEGKTKEEDDDDDEGGDAANSFFKKLYKNATPEVQRAMMKSYTESNGTALSTNWEEVSKAKVETSPPDGMDAKPW